MREKIKDYDRLIHIQESIDNVFEFMKVKLLMTLRKTNFCFLELLRM